MNYKLNGLLFSSVWIIILGWTLFMTIQRYLCEKWKSNRNEYKLAEWIFLIVIEICQMVFLIAYLLYSLFRY